MIREVFIDNQPIDISNDNAAGYIFTSPIFRDITKIMSNRTTTYKIPKTQRNLSVFNLSDTPDVYTDFPYREHTFEEYRDGLPFIKGRCTLLKAAEKEMELAVIWGATINLLKLKDVKLRDLKIKDTLRWNTETGFLWAGSSKDLGFIVTDFGQGTEIEKVSPSISVLYILNYIENTCGVTLKYPLRFEQVFTKLWIPLIENTANEETWEDGKYWVATLVKGISTSHHLTVPSRFYFESFLEGNTSLIVKSNMLEYSAIRATAGTIVNIRTNFRLIIRDATPSYKLKVYAYAKGRTYQEQYFDIYESDSIYYSVVKLDMMFDVDEDVEIQLRAIYTLNGEIASNLYRSEIDKNYLPLIVQKQVKVYVKYKEVQPGDVYPIAPNLPDLSVIDFLKSLMHLFGLFAYYDYRNDSDAIHFVSIDDIYSDTDADGKMPLKAQAVDWTHRLVDTGKGRLNLSYTYGDYAQKNLFKYKTDKDVHTNADGAIVVDNTTIADSKVLVELPFSASDNVTDENGNTYAKINLLKPDGSTNKVTNRILWEGKYEVKKEDDTFTYKSGVFNNLLQFDTVGGLLGEYYSKYQLVLRQPVLAECSVYLSELELNQFREIHPVYIDGVYYIPMEVMVQTNGLANCKLIRMPPKNN